MCRKLRIAYVAHSLRSDWNNGNAHFLRGLLRALSSLGHAVVAMEPDSGWSIDNLRSDHLGEQSIATFHRTYPDLQIETYAPVEPASAWIKRLEETDVVILHEWNPPELVQLLLQVREKADFRLLFHDTHHRASSSPEQMRLLQLDRFDGILAFGRALEQIYRERFGIDRVWTFHEAADTTVFKPLPPSEKLQEIVWIGNWGDGERSSEIQEFLLDPIAAMPGTRAIVYGVRYPEAGFRALQAAHVSYGGYKPNLDAPAVYSAACLTVHVPRQQYASAMLGIPTIRVFEALACGIPLLSAPWQDTEGLFRPGDLRFVSNAAEMKAAMHDLLSDPAAAKLQAESGLETILNRHTCLHRARQLTSICEDLLS